MATPLCGSPSQGRAGTRDALRRTPALVLLDPYINVLLLQVFIAMTPARVVSIVARLGLESVPLEVVGQTGNSNCYKLLILCLRCSHLISAADGQCPRV